MIDPIPCRLCSKTARHAFSLQVLKRLDVGYFKCDGCGSLQTEPPYWLDTAYGFDGANIDTGRALRTVQAWFRLCLVLNEIGFDRAAPCLDFGGGSGLLTRLMRDVGYDFVNHDKYAANEFATYFDQDDPGATRPSLITAFEVFEHLPEPRQTLGDLIALAPDIFVFTTTLYQGGGPDWDYLLPICGQHVFFYTDTALEAFAASHGYAFVQLPGFSVMVATQSPYLAALQKIDRTIITDQRVGQIVRAAGGPDGKAQRAADSDIAFARFAEEVAALKPDT